MPNFILRREKFCERMVQSLLGRPSNVSVKSFRSLLCLIMLFGTCLPLVAYALLMQGFMEYTRDALTVTTAAHALCAATAWGNLLLAAIPLYAVSMVASASARRSSNALSAFAGGAESTPTGAAAIATPPKRAKVRAR